MPLGYYLTVSIHLLAALFWLGGMFFLALVGAPALRRLPPSSGPSCSGSSDSGSDAPAGSRSECW